MLPVACTLSDPELTRRRAELRTGVLHEAHSVNPLPNGYRWQFATTPDLLSRLAVVIEGERHCCTFLTFRLDADEDLGHITLDVTGPEGTVDFLTEWIA